MSSTELPPARGRRARLRFSAALLVAIGGACDTALAPLVRRDWGLITLDHQTVDGADYIRPQALFYSSVSSPTLSGRGATDVCGRFQYPPLTSESVDEIPAGETVTLTMRGTDYNLTPITIGSRRPYSLPNPGIPYQPGDSVAVRIPGASDGFPAIAIRGRTAESFTLGPIGTTLESRESITWTPAGDDSSRMVVSMQYHDELRPGPGVNAHVFCTFRDDGAGTVPDALLREWTTSTGQRRVQAVRWRSSVEAEGDAVLYLVSTYTVTKTSFP